ncbi:MAG: shikimate kinase, partial [Polaribacter sp.]
MKIVLLGYMGVGKSTIGRELASKIQLPFIDLDDYIESKE